MPYRRVLNAVAVLALALPAIPQDAQIKGAQISLDTKSVAVEVVTLTNRRDSPLVAWQVSLTKSAGGGLIHTSDYSWQPPTFQTARAIGPKEERTITIHLGRESDLGAATLRLAVFDDGYIEGEPEAVDAWQRQRRRRTDDALFWVRTFASAPPGPEVEIRRYLELQAGVRAAQAGDDLSGLRSQVSQALARSREGGALAGFVPRISQEASRQYDFLTRTPKKAPALEAGAPVALTSRREMHREYAVVIKNLRDIAIEAVGFELMDPVTRKARSGQSSDYGDAPIGTPTSNTGRIGPGDTREFPLPGEPVEETAALVPRLAFAMFDDLSFEGSADRLATVLNAREQEADNISYALSVRSDAAAKSPGEAVAFLTAKREERAKSLQAEGRPIRLQYLDQLIKEAESAPERLREDTPYVQHLEKRRARLVRHLKR